MNSAQNIIKRILGRKSKSVHIEQATNKIKSTLNQAENALNELTEGGSGENLPNPYLNARRSWNEHVGSLITAKQSWQFIAILCLLITLTSIGGVIHIGSQSKFVPYVVEVDKFGQIRAQGQLKNFVADVRVIQALLVQFIADARGITADANMQRQMIFRLYAKLNNQDPAFVKMNEWLNGDPKSNPFRRAETELVDIEMRTVVAQTANTWQVEWIENTRDHKGKLMFEPQVWRALITVYTAEITKNTTDEQMLNNPLGLYVQDFNWSRVN